MKIFWFFTYLRERLLYNELHIHSKHSFCTYSRS